MAMKQSQILQLLKENYKKVSVPIPSYWFYPELDFTGELRRYNIYDLFINYFEDYIEKPHHMTPLDNFNQAIIYGAFIRTTVAFDFDQDNQLVLNNKYGLRETGTILRMFLLFPLLKKLGINVIYLLPITYSSRSYKKGEASSPYACKNFFQIDPDLYDPMLGDFAPQKLDLLFKEFVEASHNLGIKIILDFIPRTAARDNDFILEHPDWFYWIKEEEEKDFKPPFIEGVPFTFYDSKYNHKIYQSPNTKDFLKKFTISPDRIDRKKWFTLIKKIKREGINNFLELITSEFKVATAPGFSDMINDPQPLWIETTFLKLFHDFPNKSKPYISAKQPDYILFDIIKSSKAEGNQPNFKLWNVLSKIIPYWQKKFKIDGARLDMAHALPERLEKRILSSCRTINKKFIFLAEELNPKNSIQVKKAGYHAMTGNLWHQEPRWKNGELKKYFENNITRLKIPIMATAETHDTPRAMTRMGKERFFYFSLVLNYFLPYSVTFINTGFELQEIQPMNKGLDPEFSSFTKLSRHDLNYNKIALFDYTCLHWNKNHEKVIKLMEYCKNILLLYPGIKDVSCLKIIKIPSPYINIFLIKIDKGYLLFLFNTHMNKNFKINFTLPLKNINYPLILLSSFLYYNKKKFTEAKLLRRIKIKQNRFNCNIKKSEVLIIKIS